MIHGGPAAVGLDDRQGGVETTIPAESDGLLELGELGRRRLCGRVQVLPLDAVVRDERSEAIDRGGDDSVGFRVRFQVSLVAGEEVAALAGLGVPEVREHVIQAHDDIVAQRESIPDPANGIQIPKRNK